MRTSTSATCRSKSRAISRWPSSFTKCIFISTRLVRWYPLQFRQSARPRCLDARNASFLAMAPAVVGFHGWVCLRGGLTAVSDGIVASACVVCTIRRHAADLLIARNLV